MPPLTWNRISYSELNSKQQEISNFAEVAYQLSKFGWLCTRLTDDWGQADFLAQHISSTPIQVQLKSKLDIQKKYQGKNLHLAWKMRGRWYLGLHDEVVEKLRIGSKYLLTPGWKKENGGYSTKSPSRAVVSALREFLIPEA
ncbi:MAG: hypothetical protein IT548_18920 [Alphaproteobacteria bacterium]|nr:hypothetical protein [Alphaproteobacteria bacterium]